MEIIETNVELKPCPFCGSEALTRSVDGGCLPSFIDLEKQNEIMSKTPYVTTCTLSCDECGATVQGYAATDDLTNNDIFDKAVADCYRKWNRRKKMGYRLTILCPDLCESPELGKFYGYVKHDNLKSIKYLVDNHLLPDDDPDIFYYNEYGPDILLTAEQFREFMDLYQEDVNNHDFSNDCINYRKPFNLKSWWPLFDEVYKNEKRKVIYWR